MTEAGGAAAGVPQNAWNGLSTATDANGALWAFNPDSSEWQLIHVVQRGDTLWKLSGLYYGQSSLAGVRAIHGVGRNQAVQGRDPNTGLIPGDQILITGLVQPSIAPASSDALPSPVAPANDYTVGVAADVVPPGSTAPGGGIPIPTPMTDEGAPGGAWSLDSPIPGAAPQGQALLDAPSATIGNGDATLVANQQQPIQPSEPAPPADEGSTLKTWLVGGGIALAAGLVIVLWPKKRRKRR